MELDFSTLVPLDDNYEDTYNKLLGVIAKTLKYKCDPIVSVTICDNEFIHKINRDYRHIDRPTDVISFAFIDDLPNKDKILFQKGELPLGDIYISYEKAVAQAKEYGHSIEREMCFLFVHGMLHLSGYDHMTKEDEEIMFPLQEKILKKYMEEKDE